MKTYCFIGTDKNAGKTTAFNAVYAERIRKGEPLLLTSIGINGETTDEFDGGVKPGIRVMPGSFFVTAGEHLEGHTGKYETCATFVPPRFAKPLVLGRCTLAFDILLEGPNTGVELALLKQELERMIPPEAILLIDGSIDRQFLANPDLCDAFYFSVLFSKREPQRRKAEGFLAAIAFAGCTRQAAEAITAVKTDATRALLFDENGVVIHHGEAMPFTDKALHGKLGKLGKLGATPALLYLNGALTLTLAEHLAPLSGLTLILDNMTLYQNVSAGPRKALLFKPEIRLLHTVKVKRIFIREEAPFDRSLLPANTEVHNLFRDGTHGIGI
ncbi:hypothetical protein DSLASN_49430 [Desulfoluna limicola]|uniref:Uncharacterized protein n=1 Tax=Desulfoluna limicola TaxID=2810562 RepID=A0ABN6FAM5_9BACT|nr:hypothetical protein [Desulfoluna limicola]BCS99311.1 hypothetical protein DSLASN_49430 [Desulfoluna limicola]